MTFPALHPVIVEALVTERKRRFEAEAGHARLLEQLTVLRRRNGAARFIAGVHHKVARVQPRVPVLGLAKRLGGAT